MFHLTVLTPEKKMLVDSKVEQAIVPGMTGELEILSGHSPLMSVLSTGIVKYKPENGEESAFSISWGYCEVSPAGVNILAETAEAPSEVDLSRAKKAEEDAAKALADGGLDAEEIEKYSRKLDRARSRRELVDKFVH